MGAPRDRGGSGEVEQRKEKRGTRTDTKWRWKCSGEGAELVHIVNEASEKLNKGTSQSQKKSGTKAEEKDRCLLF